jgi:hypothetical protein
MAYIDKSLCCIAGCYKVGTHFHDGRFYCMEHWQEAVGETPVDFRACCSNPVRCSVTDCSNEGVITQYPKGVRTHYCVDHAWKADRPDEAGLRHPLKANWNAEDALRAHVMGLAVSEKDLPAVSESVAEECRRELEEGRKKGWKIR